MKIDNRHFQEWIILFEATINENFYGEKAEEAIHRAKNMALMFETKHKHINGGGSGNQ